MTRRLERFVNWVGDWLLPLLLTTRFYKVLIWVGASILLLVLLVWAL